MLQRVAPRDNNIQKRVATVVADNVLCAQEFQKIHNTETNDDGPYINRYKNVVHQRLQKLVLKKFQWPFLPSISKSNEEKDLLAFNGESISDYRTEEPSANQEDSQNKSLLIDVIKTQLQSIISYILCAEKPLFAFLTGRFENPHWRAQWQAKVPCGIEKKRGLAS